MNEDECFADVVPLLEEKNAEASKLEKELIRYHDAEEMIGVDLVTYARMTVGTVVYVKNDAYKDFFKDGIIAQPFRAYSYSMSLKCFCADIYGTKTPIYYVKDIGKTWSLIAGDLKK